jgi:hypothetical protein
MARRRPLRALLGNDRAGQLWLAGRGDHRGDAGRREKRGRTRGRIARRSPGMVKGIDRSARRPGRWVGTTRGGPYANGPDHRV